MESLASFEPQTWLVLLVMGVLLAFLPVNALAYFLFRRHRRHHEVNRILSLLSVQEEYRGALDERDSPGYFLLALGYAMAVAAVGLGLLFLGSSLGYGELPSLTMSAGEASISFPAQGSRLICGMAFLGAYCWGIQHIQRRYAQNDLSPGVYFGLAMRMTLAAITALVIYNGFGALTGEPGSQQGITGNIWPALAFMIGMVPQRGIGWLAERLPIVSRQVDPSTRAAPLTMIEGLGADDQLRLTEHGIDCCYDLANADFVPLVLKTPYPARSLIDWILQAKLCALFGSSIRDLRNNGILTVRDLMRLSEEELEALAPESTLTLSSLRRARLSLQQDEDLDRLQAVAALLGRYSLDPTLDSKLTGIAEAASNQVKKTST